MRKAYDSEKSGLLEIKPVEEIVNKPSSQDRETIGDEPITFYYQKKQQKQLIIK
jgi:hypothetical protein